MKKNLFVFTINCDWRDIFRSARQEFEDKMRRDHLGVEKNIFFILSFARVSYQAGFKNYRTVHLRTRLDWFRPLLDLRAFFSVIYYALSNKLQPDIWLAYDFGFLPALWLARLFLGGRIVMVLTNQPRVYSRTRNWGAIKSIYSALLEKLFHSLPDQFMTINETMRAYLMSLGVSEKKISVFYTNTIKRDEELIAHSVLGRARSRLDLAVDVKILLSVARLEAEKNFPRLLELFASLDKNCVLVILGQGSLLLELRKQAELLGIAERVFFEGWVDREGIWDYYRDANLFILLSKAEALGIVFWEAMYLGVPALGSTVSGIMETIGQDGERGRLWDEAEGADTFRSKVDFCLTPSHQREEMIARAKDYVVVQIANPVTLNSLFL